MWVVILPVDKSNAQKEIERKFIIDSIPDNIDSFPHKEIIQGYIVTTERSDMRIRDEGGKYLLTVKKGTGIERDEIEINISEEQFKDLWKSVEKEVKKIRYEVPAGRFMAYIDVYKGKLTGLVMGEVEFRSVEEAMSFEVPVWFGKDVTEDEYYKNKSLSGPSYANAQKLIRRMAEAPKYLLDKGIQEVIHRIELLSSKLGRPIVVEIAGGSASGKTSAVAFKIKEAFGETALLISLDDYYLGLKYIMQKEAEGEKINFDQPEAINISALGKDLASLKEGKPIYKPIYDFKAEETASYEKVDPKGKKVVILEGLFSLDNSLKKEGDLKVFVDVSMHDRVMRRLIRDSARTSWSLSNIIGYMLSVAEPMYRKYIEPEKYNADIIISNPYIPILEAMKIVGEERQVKYRVDGKSAELADKLEKMGAERLGTVEQEDYYFMPPDMNLEESDEMVRVRKENGAVLFEYKGPRQEDGSRKRMSFEIDNDTFLQLLSYYSLGFMIKKRRTVYNVLGITLSLDRDVQRYEKDTTVGLRDIGDFIEAREGLVPKSTKRLQEALGLGSSFSEPYSKM